MGGGVDPILSVRLGVGLLLTSQCPRAPALTSRPRRAQGQGSTPRALGGRRRPLVHRRVGVAVSPGPPRADAEAVGLSPLPSFPSSRGAALGAGPRGARARAPTAESLPSCDRPSRGRGNDDDPAERPRSRGPRATRRGILSFCRAVELRPPHV